MPFSTACYYNNFKKDSRLRRIIQHPRRCQEKDEPQDHVAASRFVIVQTSVAQRAPSTESLSAFAGVKRRRVRAGIFISAPVAGLRPMRALLLRLRKIPSPARRSEPSFFNSRTTRPVSSSSADLACFLLMPSLSARWAATCVCVIILLLAAENGLT